MIDRKQAIGIVADRLDNFPREKRWDMGGRWDLAMAIVDALRSRQKVTDEMVERALIVHFNETRKVYGLSFLDHIEPRDLQGAEGQKMRKTLEAALQIGDD